MNKPLEDQLTDQKKKVLKLVVQGFTNQEIANRLYIAENTAKVHLRQLTESFVEALAWNTDADLPGGRRLIMLGCLHFGWLTWLPPWEDESLPNHVTMYRALNILLSIMKDEMTEESVQTLQRRIRLLYPPQEGHSFHQEARILQQLVG